MTETTEVNPQETKNLSSPAGDPDTTPPVEETPLPEFSKSYEFENPNLAGKTPQEIEAYTRLLESTVKSQSGRLTADFEKQQEPAPEPLPDWSRDDFFEDPITIMTQVVRREMSNTVAPINREIENMRAQAGVNVAWESAKAKFADFERYRPAIESMIASQGMIPAQVTGETLEALYYGAVGYYASQGITPGGETITPKTDEPVPPAAPPQHRPSRAPLPTPVTEGKTVRDLTEEERQIARHWKLTPEEYLAEQEKDIADVVGGAK